MGNDVYVDVEMIKLWSEKLKNLNDESQNLLNLMLDDIKSLNDYMLGNVANGFINDSKELVNEVKKGHTNMSNVEDFLYEVANRTEQR